MAKDKYFNVDNIIAWESEGLEPDKELKFFSEGIKTGQVWQLQGVYGRTAKAYQDEGLIDEKGNITKKGKMYSDDYKTNSPQYDSQDIDFSGDATYNIQKGER